MKKSVKQATAEEILSDVCYYEDPDSILKINATEDGKVFVADNEWRDTVIGDTFKEALIKFQIKKWKRRDYSMQKMKEYAEETKELNWNTAIHDIKEP